jgi:hypothetical protein
MGWRSCLRQDVAIGEAAVAEHDVTTRHRDRMREDRAGRNKGVELAAFAAGVDAGRQFGAMAAIVSRTRASCLRY